MMTKGNGERRWQENVFYQTTEQRTNLLSSSQTDGRQSWCKHHAYCILHETQKNEYDLVSLHYVRTEYILT